MAASNFLYRSGKKLVNVLPAWLLRFRPFGVYEILLQQLGGESTTTQLSRRSQRGVLPCQVRWVAESEVPMLRRVASHRTCADFNSKTCRAVAAWFEGQAIACAWIATESFEEVDLGLRFELHSADAWLFAAVVDEPRRGQGVYEQLLQFLVDELNRQSMQRILLGVSVGNEPSRRAHARQGAIQVGGIIAGRSLGFIICRRRGRVRRLSPLAIAWRKPIRLVVNKA
jgi:GNAT superfamily N-acetyltransferase